MVALIHQNVASLPCYAPPMEAVVALIVTAGMAKRHLIEGTPFLPDGAVMVASAAAAVYFARAAMNKHQCQLKAGSGD